MDFKVLIVDSAIADLKEIVKFVAQHNPDAALRLGESSSIAFLLMTAAAGFANGRPALSNVSGTVICACSRLRQSNATALSRRQ